MQVIKAMSQIDKKGFKFIGYPRDYVSNYRDLHAELKIIQYMFDTQQIVFKKNLSTDVVQKSDILEVGISKLSCFTCDVTISGTNTLIDHVIKITGAHGQRYPTAVPPFLLRPEHAEIARAVLCEIYQRQGSLSDLENLSTLDSADIQKQLISEFNRNYDGNQLNRSQQHTFVKTQDLFAVLERYQTQQKTALSQQQESTVSITSSALPSSSQWAEPHKSQITTAESEIKLPETVEDVVKNLAKQQQRIQSIPMDFAAAVKRGEGKGGR